MSRTGPASILTATAGCAEGLMSAMPEASATFGLRVLRGSSDLATRFQLDFDQKHFRRNYRQPVLVSAQAAASAGEMERWFGGGGARLLGYDVAARALNRVAAEGAEPLFARAVLLHGQARVRAQLAEGVTDACLAGDTVLQEDRAESGAGPCAAVMAVGVVERRHMMNRRRFRAGDAVLAVGSDRLWPPLAERAAALGPEDKTVQRRSKQMSDALPHLLPVPVMAGQIRSVLRRYTVKRVVHAMTPVEGDGLVAALSRLTGDSFEVRPARGERVFSEAIALLRERGLAGDGADEGHLRGIGMLIVAGQPFAEAIARRLRRQGLPTWQYGRLATTGAP